MRATKIHVAECNGTRTTTARSTESDAQYCAHIKQWLHADAAMLEAEVSGSCRPDLPDARAVHLAASGARSREEKEAQTRRRDTLLSASERRHEYDVLEQAHARLGDVLAELEAHPDVTVSYRRGKEARMRQVYHALDSCLSLLNEAGSMVFTFVTLRAFSFVLFICSVIAMCANAIMRFAIAASNRNSVDTGRAKRCDESTGWADQIVTTGPNKRWFFWTRAVPLYLLEPHVGRDFIQEAMAKEGVYAAPATATENRDVMFTRDVHPMAINAVRSAAACRNDISTSLLLVCVEDMPELAVEVAYLLMSTGSVTPFFVLSASGTVMSIARQLYELVFDLRARHRLLRATTHTDKSFHAQNDSPATLAKWAADQGEIARIVELEKCTWLDAASLACLAHTCPYLDELNLDGASGIDDAAIVPVSEALWRLRKLKLNGCSGVGNSSALAIAKHCLELRVLFVPKTGISDDGFEAIASNCRYLSSVSIVGTPAGDRTFNALARHVGASLLACYAGSTGITDAGMRLLAAGCPNIRILTCGDGAVTDAGLFDFVQKCPRLLMLTANRKFTADGLLAVIHHCPSIRVVWCSACNQEKGGKVDDTDWSRLEAAADDAGLGPRIFRH